MFADFKGAVREIRERGICRAQEKKAREREGVNKALVSGATVIYFSEVFHAISITHIC